LWVEVIELRGFWYSYPSCLLFNVGF
jgi:hypothetical protein